jgi:glycine/D-amino acid oxidase-like deaminating enzyme
MRIAVVGAGLAGLSVAWHALSQAHEVLLFDPKGVGGGASGVSTGLMHPFAGKSASMSWRASEAMAASLQLFEIAEKALNIPVMSRSGIFRPSITDSQKKDFQNNQNSQAIWKEIELPGMPPTWGLWIPEGVTVFSRMYLKGLWMACKSLGAVLIQESFVSEEGFDRIVIAAGFDSMDFAQCRNLPVRTAIGQSLVCEVDDLLPFSLASHGYITLTEDPFICQVGSTYEHTKQPDPQKAIDLIEKVSLFYPPAKQFRILEIRSGIRIAPREGHVPILAQVGPKTFVFTGLGSRGMLYHALLGRLLVEKLSS